MKHPWILLLLYELISLSSENMYSITSVSKNEQALFLSNTTNKTSNNLACLDAALQIGDNVYSCLTESARAIMTIYGSGPTYHYSELESPLLGNKYSIAKVEDGITSFGDYLFQNTSLRSINIPLSLTYIGKNVFKDNTAIATTIGLQPMESPEFSFVDYILYDKDQTRLIYAFNVNDKAYSILDSVVTIDDGAFITTNSPYSITLNSKVKYLTGQSFSNCKYLTQFIITTENPYFTVDDGILYSKDMSRLIKYPSQKSGTTFTIPESVTTIDDFAFEVIWYVTTLTIGSNVKEIGSHAFSNNVQLTTFVVESANTAFSTDDGVIYSKDKKILLHFPSKKMPTDNEFEIPDTVTTIGEYAFENSLRVRTVYYPPSLTHISSYAFFHSPIANLYPKEEGQIQEGSISIDKLAFLECENLKTIILPQTAIISDSAFLLNQKFNNLTYLGETEPSCTSKSFQKCSLTTVRVTPKYQSDSFCDFPITGRFTPTPQATQTLSPSPTQSPEPTSSSDSAPSKTKKIIIGLSVGISVLFVVCIVLFIAIFRVCIKRGFFDNKRSGHLDSVYSQTRQTPLLEE